MSRESSTGAIGSTQRLPGNWCGTSDVHRRLLSTDPDYVRNRDASETHAWNVRRKRLGFRSAITHIVCVVHVVWFQEHQNIPDEQILGQLEALNRDFRASNEDRLYTPAPFAPLVADALLAFRLAWKDPAGNPTSGVTRTRTEIPQFGTDDHLKYAALGGADAWSPDRYLNIWVAPLAPPLGGFATPPGQRGNSDGVAINYEHFGTSSPHSKLGRTTVHEIGHWLNLIHIWGDDGTGCNGTDYVEDTPNQAGPNMGAPTFPHVSCDNGPNGDMFMNFMDYADDSVAVMFTRGQVARMHACLDHDRPGIGVMPTSPAQSVGRLFGYAGNTARVVGRTTESHIGEIAMEWFGWNAFDMTVATQAPLAAGDPMGYVGNTQRVVYRGQDNHVHEISLGAAGWGHFDMTVATQAPLAAGDPMGYEYAVPRIVYVDQSSRPRELSIDPNHGQWTLSGYS